VSQLNAAALRDMSESFDAKPAAPGAFRIGLEKTTEKGPVLSVRIITPVHSAP
jgi:hypothetical protein